MEFNMLFLLIIGLGIIVGGYFVYQKSKRGDDVKHIDPASQERGPKRQDSDDGNRQSQANVNKTAQLEALRGRLGDNAGKKQSTAKRIGSGGNAGSGFNAGKKVEPSFTAKPVESVKPAQESVGAQTAPEQIDVESWVPTDDLGESAVDSFLRKPSMSGNFDEDTTSDNSILVKNDDLIGAIGELPPIVSAPNMPSTNLQKPDQKLISSIAPFEESAPASTSSLKTGNVKAVEHSKLQQVSPPNKIITGLASGGKALILLVDDSKVIRVKTEKLLVAAGYSVVLAIDGIDALSKLETVRPDLVITDIEMPNLDGFGLVRSLKGNLQTNEIPVIVMTSHVNLHLDIAATEGINGFLPKPFNDQDLLDQVSYLISS